jgi:hypothetical protein
MRMTQQWTNAGLHFSRGAWIAVLLLTLVAAPVLTVVGQEEPVIQRIYGTLNLFPQTDLPALVQLAVALDLAPDLHAALLAAPRDYLATQTLTAPIVLAADAFQVTTLDFSIVPEATEDRWFGIAAPLEGLAFEPKGIGIFYRSVGIFLQEAHEPTGSDVPGGMGVNNGNPIEQVGEMLALVSRLSATTLDTLRAAMKELNRLAIDSPDRASFLHNPREYLLGRELTLPASIYRIIALDFDRAAVVGAVKSDRIRAGLAVIPEGIGVFGTDAGVGIFLQLAI